MTISNNTRGNKYHDSRGRFCSHDVCMAQNSAIGEYNSLMDALEKGQQPKAVYEFLEPWRDPSSPDYDPERTKMYEKVRKAMEKQLGISRLYKLLEKRDGTKGSSKPAVSYSDTPYKCNKVAKPKSKKKPTSKKKASSPKPRYVYKD